jgi:hypothetical protein
MPCITQSQLAWGEGDSTSSRVLAVCGAYPRIGVLELVRRLISHRVPGRAIGGAEPFR